MFLDAEEQQMTICGILVDLGRVPVALAFSHTKHIS